MATVGILSIDLRARTGKFVKSLALARRSLDRFAAKTLLTNTGLFRLGALAQGGAIIGLVALINKSRNAIDSLGKMSDELNIATEDLVGFRLAAELTGTSISILTKGFQRMVRRLGELALGGGEALKFVDKLGISIESLVALNAADQMKQVAKAILALPNAAQRAAVAFSLFGRQGQELMNFLLLGAKGMEAIKAEAIAMGLSLNRNATKQVEIMNDALLLAGRTITGLVNKLTVKLAPIVVEISRAFKEWAVSAGGADAKVGLLATKMGFLTAVSINFGLISKGLWEGLELLVIGVLATITKKLATLVTIFSKFTPLKFIPGIKDTAIFLQEATKEFEKSMLDNVDSIGEAFDNIMGRKSILKLEARIRNAAIALKKEAEETLKKEAEQRGAGVGVGVGIEGFRKAQREARFREIEALQKATESRDPEVAKEAQLELIKMNKKMDSLIDVINQGNKIERNKKSNRNAGTLQLLKKAEVLGLK